MRTLLAFLAVALAGCATVVPPPGSYPAPGPFPEPAPLPEPAARTENLAIAGLLDGARADAAAGRLANAASALERAGNAIRVAMSSGMKSRWSTGAPVDFRNAGPIVGTGERLVFRSIP